MIAFDPTVTLGAIFEIGVVLVTAIGFFIALDQKSRNLELKTEERHEMNEKRFCNIEGELKEQTKILHEISVDTATQKEKIRHIEAHVYLRNSRGSNRDEI
jgi:hypothetical protein